MNINLKRGITMPINLIAARAVVGAVSCAAAVAVFAHPVGALGGAIYGAMYGATDQVVLERTSRVRSVAGRHLLTIAKIAIAWKLAAVCGVTMGFGTAIVLSLAPAVAMVAITILGNLRYGRDPLIGV